MRLLDNPIFKINIFDNAVFFANRFPELAASMGINSKEGIKRLLSLIPSDYLLQESKTKFESTVIYTANIHNKFIHSKYNPIREAEQILGSSVFANTSGKKGCIFYGLGLGYLHEMYARKNTESELVIVEPDVFIFLFFLASRQLSDFFKHKKLTLILGAYPNDALIFFEKIESKDYTVFKFTSAMEVSSSWFLEFETLQKRRIEKNNLNKNTLKKFGKLWTKNFFKNLRYTEELSGISIFENQFSGYSALIIAAGPSLTSVLPLIKDYAEKFIIIASDTAVRACLKFNIIPDFILLMDAQYWNYLHLADIDISSSVLITELTVYPQVFRLNAKAKFLTSSVFPFANLIEEKIGGFKKIVTGGSVATACWDFARFIGVKEIIAVGLDLGFPQFQTHFRGSRFEEDSNKKSTRLQTAEAASHFSLYSAYPEIAESYEGKVFTDARMKMYAWWFESKIAEFPLIKTFNLLSQGLKIPNMPRISEKEFLLKVKDLNYDLSFKQKKINEIVNASQNRHKKLKLILSELIKELVEIQTDVNNAISISNELYSSNFKFLNTEAQNILLNKIETVDKKLHKNKFNLCIGFDILLTGEEFNSDNAHNRSSNFYTLISENIKILLTYLQTVK